MNQSQSSTRVFAGLGIVLSLIAVFVFAILYSGNIGAPVSPNPTLSTTQSKTPSPISMENPTEHPLSALLTQRPKGWEEYYSLFLTNTRAWSEVEAFLSITPSPTTTPTLKPVPLSSIEARGPVSIAEIKMVDAQQGWALGSDNHSELRVLRTADGGRRWQNVSPPVLGHMDWQQDMLRLTRDYIFFFLDNQRAWFASVYDETRDSITLWITEDGGKSWTGAPSTCGCWAKPRTGDPYCVMCEFFAGEGNSYFIDSLHGWIAYSLGPAAGSYPTLLYRTTDGGYTWDVLASPEAADVDFQSGLIDFTFINAQTGLVPNGSEVMRTVNGGESWDWISFPRPSEAADDSECTSRQLAFFAPQTVVIWQLWWNGNRLAIYTERSDDGGQTWHTTRRPGPDNITLESTFFVMQDLNIGWVFEKDIYQTLDGGSTWTKIAAAPWYEKISDYAVAPDPGLVRVDFVDASTGWVRILGGEIDPALLYQTLDGGRTWTLIEPHLVDAQ